MTISSASANGADKSVDAALSVDDTSVVINPNESDQSQDIVGDTATGTGSFLIKNTGLFALNGLTIQHDADDSWLALTTPESGGCGSTLAVGSSCRVEYAIDGNHDMSSVITVTGANTTATNEDFIPDASISFGIEGDSIYQHLSYRSLRITNLTSVEQTLSVISAAPPASLSEKIVLCDALGSNCESDFASTCLEADKRIAGGGFCHIWYKANPQTELSKETSDNAKLSVTASASTGQSHTLSRSVDFHYGNELYAAGNFSKMGEVAVDYIVRWDGDHWRPLGTGLTRRVSALVFDGKDVYVGGLFKHAGGHKVNYLARWSGDSWEALDGGVNNRVFSLAAQGKNIYAGGSFTKVGSSNVKASRVAKWDGSSWSGLGENVKANRSVFSLAMDGDDLYVGGSFTQIGGVPTAGLAKWDGSDWTAENNNTSDRSQILALKYFQGGLYLGGSFSLNNSMSASGIAYWLEGKFYGFDSEYFRLVRSFIERDNQLFIGGIFYNPTSKTYYSLAQWDGLNLTFLD